MRDQVARSEMRGGVFVVDPKIRQVFAHRLVPIEFSLPHQGGERRDRELLRHRSDRHLRFRGHRQFFLHVAQAVAFREHHVVAHHHRDRDAGDLKCFQLLLDDCVDPGERLSRRRFLGPQSGSKKENG